MKKADRSLKPALWMTLAIVSLSLFAAGCSRKEPVTEQPKQAIFMGGIYPLTGPLSVFGQAARQGLETGVDYANKNILAGSPFVLQAAVEDSQGDPTTGVTAYRRLVDGKKAKVCNAILSNVAIAVKPLADQDNVLLFADATHSSLVGGNSLRHSQSAEQEALFLLNFCRTNLKPTRIVAIVADDDYGESFLKALGSEVTGVRYDAKAADLKPVALRVAGENPDAIIAVGVGGPLGEIIRALREGGYKGNILSTVAFDVVPSTRKVAGDAARGVWFPKLAYDADMVRQLFHDSQSTTNLAGASAVKIIAFNDAVFVAKALAAGKTTPTEMRAFILSHSQLDGIGIKATPQPNGALLPQLEMKRVE